MRITNKHKLLGALAVAGIVAASGSAFTGTGLTNSAGSTQYVGGTVSQSVTGATLASVTYGFSDGAAQTAVNSVLLTFADANTDAKTPTIVVGNSVGAFTCTAIEATNHTSTCTGAASTGVTGVAITVA